MYKNARDARFETAYLPGMTALFTRERLEADSIPRGIYSYTILHGEDPAVPERITHHGAENHFGTLLTNQPIEALEEAWPIPVSQLKLDMGFEAMSLDAWLFQYGDDIKNRLQAANRERLEAGVEGRDFYTYYPLEQEEARLITWHNEQQPGYLGYLRGAFSKGPANLAAWFGSKDAQFTRRFEQDLRQTVRELEEGLLQSRGVMRCRCREEGATKLADKQCAFAIESPDHLYLLRCSLVDGDYDYRLFCYNKQQLWQGISERQAQEGQAPEMRQ